MIVVVQKKLNKRNAQLINLFINTW